MIKKLIRKLIRWAMADVEGSFVISFGADVSIERPNAEEIFIRGASTPRGRKVITNTIRRAQLNREI